jgi:uncharacterized membrane protein
MSAGALAAEFAVPFYGALLCVAPAVDRFWKGGLLYVNRDDPALMVGARLGVGWTFNLANPAAWLLLSAIAGVPAGLVVIAVLTR